MRTALALLAVLGGLTAAILLLFALPEGESNQVRATLSAVGAIAGGDTAGFARAAEPREFQFPQDHGPHPEYRTEWWYLTGNLEDQEGSPYGFQLTFFRNSLTPDPPGRLSAWDTNQLWMAHLALTDVAGGSHVTGERFARGAAGMAGARIEPFRVWLGDWEIRHLDRDSAAPEAGMGSGAAPGGRTSPGSDPAPGAFPMQLRASQDGWGLELILTARKPPVYQGDRGLSQKGPEPRNASYYLSWTRLEARGTVVVQDRRREVAGSAWMDREWSTSALGEAHVGWDWFSLQLSDGRELMFFELRRRDGMQDSLNHGALVEPDGSHRRLGADDVVVEVLEHWASPLDGARYPGRWRLRIPREDLELEVTPRVADQEMNLSVRYWEGAVAVEGRSAGAPLSGVGYVELTGYGEGEDGGSLQGRGGP